MKFLVTRKMTPIYSMGNIVDFDIGENAYLGCHARMSDIMDKHGNYRNDFDKGFGVWHGVEQVVINPSTIRKMEQINIPSGVFTKLFLDNGECEYIATCLYDVVHFTTNHNSPDYEERTQEMDIVDMFE